MAIFGIGISLGILGEDLSRCSMRAPWSRTHELPTLETRIGSGVLDWDGSSAAYWDNLNLSRAVLLLLNIRFLCSGVRYDVLDNAFISRARFLFWEVLSFWLDVGDEASVE